MYGKIEITGEIEVITGMHIGGSSEFSAIGAVDNAIVKDPINHYPMIPGSSLKGKMRTLLARTYNENYFTKHDSDDARIKRLFGAANSDTAMPSRLIFSDAFLTEESRQEILDSGAMSVTEVKFENTINRLTGVANPRQMERAVRGCRFPLSVVYEVITDNSELASAEVEEDFKVIVEGLKLLQLDYIGGSGSRGYGKIRFKSLSATPVMGQIDDSIIEKCRKLLEEVTV